jgi:hypothetical protein
MGQRVCLLARLGATLDHVVKETVYGTDKPQWASTLATVAGSAHVSQSVELRFRVVLPSKYQVSGGCLSCPV